MSEASDVREGVERFSAIPCFIGNRQVVMCVRAADYDALQERCEALTAETKNLRGERDTNRRLLENAVTDQSNDEDEICNLVAPIVGRENPLDDGKGDGHGRLSLAVVMSEAIGKLRTQLAEANQRCEAAEREVADCVTALGASPPQDDFPYWAIQDVGQFNSARECWPALAKEWRAQLATLTAENARLAGELEAVRGLLMEINLRLTEYRLTSNDPSYMGDTATLSTRIEAALSPAAGVSHE